MGEITVNPSFDQVKIVVVGKGSSWESIPQVVCGKNLFKCLSFQKQMFQRHEIDGMTFD